jgi:ribonuclease HI
MTKPKTGPRPLLEALARTLSLDAARRELGLSEAQARTLLQQAAAAFPAEPAKNAPGGKAAELPLPATVPGGRVRIHCDGASRGNPGPAAAGLVVITPDGAQESLGEVLGTMTNNQAEYRALLLGLRLCVERGYREVEFLLDSELVVRQVNGQYKVKNADLLPLYREADRLRCAIPHCVIRHVPREQNAGADAAANAALDGNS